MKDTTEPPKTVRPSIHLSIEDWMPCFEHKDISDAEKIELINNLWSIAKAFVDLGWELDVAEEFSGQGIDLTAALRAAVLYSEQYKSTDKEFI
ncbi:MAG: hypothetical protein AAGB07_00740 [Pseudomonadota bacterium]